MSAPKLSIDQTLVRFANVLKALEAKTNPKGADFTTKPDYVSTVYAQYPTTAGYKPIPKEGLTNSMTYTIGVWRNGMLKGKANLVWGKGSMQVSWSDRDGDLTAALKSTKSPKASAATMQFTSAFKTINVSRDAALRDFKSLLQVGDLFTLTLKVVQRGHEKNPDATVLRSITWGNAQSTNLVNFDPQREGLQVVADTVEFGDGPEASDWHSVFTYPVTVNKQSGSMSPGEKIASTFCFS